MRSPSSTRAAPRRSRLSESHISWVFLAGDRAYKLRKPVVFPFLDYGTPERRREMCETELRLGRRLAPTYICAFGRWCAPTTGGHSANPANAAMSTWSRCDASTRATRSLLDSRGTTLMWPRSTRGEADRQLHRAAEPAPAGSFDAGTVAATVGENWNAASLRAGGRGA